MSKKKTGATEAKEEKQAREKEKTSGVLIVAMKHPYYGCLAYNLALTLRAAQKDIAIHVIADDIALSYLDATRREVFDKELKAKSDSPFDVKLSLDMYTQFDCTLYMDADTAWLNKKPAEMFDALSGVAWTCANHGAVLEKDLTDSTSQWLRADIKEFYSAHGLKGAWPRLSSEMMYFEKGKESSALFSAARKFKPKTNYVQFAGGIPDELALGVAVMQTEMRPHEEPWHPAYWEYAHAARPQQMSQINSEYFAYSIGGNILTELMKQQYGDITKRAATTTQMSIPFLPRNKRHLIQNRENI